MAKDLNPVSIGATVARVGDATDTLAEPADRPMFESKRRDWNLVSYEMQEG